MILKIIKKNRLLININSYICNVINIYTNKKQNNMEKYKQNLRLEGNKVISYTTHVATINGNDLIQLGYWSQTTQKHINYVANELSLNLIKS
tara:strand:+ start:163 stop:438 length:276 start_codon:yes stop_codon:yes gene_type:complete